MPAIMTTNICQIRVGGSKRQHKGNLGRRKFINVNQPTKLYVLLTCTTLGMTPWLSYTPDIGFIWDDTMVEQSITE